ncbi:beta-ketoacyl synthase N-terminal-like domain-containing protein [Streptomyces pactum]|uniref:beta-ketoacyl synthase N-terminal-like domain-containing protein n=1 Tax=Streptomyces pactum TaxID=68249 RepID=UPI0036FDA3F4
MSSSTAPTITAWAAVSPFGIGRKVFRDGLLADAPAAPGEPAGPDAGAFTVPGFDAREVLGKKGTRSMDRVTALAAATVGELLRTTPGLADEAGPHPRRAIVLGTTTGSAQSMMDFTRSSLTEARPYLVDPARFPNTVMNCAAGACAIRYQLKGPNATIGGGRAAGLHALNYARRLHRTGRAGSVLCGGAEEYTAARAWLQHHARPDGDERAVLGEGCAMVFIEPAGAGGDERPGLAEVLAVEFGVHDDQAGPAEVLAGCVRRALEAADAAPDRVWAVAPGGAAGPLGEGERAGLAQALGGAAPRRVTCAPLIGDTSAAAASFQLVSLLALAESDPAAAGRLALVTAVDPGGTVGCAVLRMLGTGPAA